MERKSIEGSVEQAVRLTSRWEVQGTGWDFQPFPECAQGPPVWLAVSETQTRLSVVPGYQFLCFQIYSSTIESNEERKRVGMRCKGIVVSCVAGAARRAGWSM